MLWVCYVITFYCKRDIRTYRHDICRYKPLPASVWDQFPEADSQILACERLVATSAGHLCGDSGPLARHCLGGSTPLTGRAIQLNAIAATYDREPVWADISGVFAPGSLTAIVGPNGAGKSTLVKALLRDIPLTAGSIDFGDLHLRDFGYLPQARKIDRNFPVNVLDMVLLGAWRTNGAFGRPCVLDIEHAREALAIVHLTGFETRPIGALSVGQFQRVLFARLMVQDAKIIVLDEPFAALDAPAIRDLLTLIDAWHAQGRTIIAVLHDIAQVRQHFPATILLGRGTALWGETEDILTRKRLRWAFEAEAPTELSPLFETTVPA